MAGLKRSETTVFAPNSIVNLTIILLNAFYL